MKNHKITFYLKGIVFIAMAWIGSLAWAQDQSFILEFGFQDTDIKGNENAYLSQSNMDDGLFLNTLQFDKNGGVFDHLSISAAGFGAKPNGRFNIQFQNLNKFKFNLKYTSLNQFNALPGVGQVPEANGLYFGDYVYDRDLHNLDMELLFLPKGRFSPFIGVRYNQLKGPSNAFYHTGEDEFKLTIDLEEASTEYYAGLMFNFEKVQGELVQGYRVLDGSENRILAPDSGNGASDGTILGENIYLDRLTGDAEWDSSSPTTRLNLTGTMNDKLSYTAGFHFGDIEIESTDMEVLAGNLVSFHTQRYYTGRSSFISAKTENPNWFGRLDLHFQMNTNFKFKIGFQKKVREVTGKALVETLYLDSVTFGTDHSSDLQDDIAPQTYMERDEERVHATLIGKINKNLRFWIGGAIDKQDITLNPDLSEIILNSGQGGDFKREITRLRAGASFKHNKRFQLRAEWESSDSDDAVVRTDYLSRDKLSLRLKTQMGSHFQLLANMKQIEAENDAAQMTFDQEFTEYSVEAIVNFDHITCNLHYGVFDLESNHTLLRPDNFTYEPSVHIEDGEEIGFDTTIKIKKFQFTGNFTRYENAGIYGFNLDQIHADARWQVSKSLTAGVQLYTRDYSDTSFPISDFEAKRYALILRYSL